MPRHPEISGSICNYVTSRLIAGRVERDYPNHPGVVRIWENTADAWNNRVLADWGW